MAEITMKLSEKTKTISEDLYGIFLEDINFACDGGLNANMVNNYSFDGRYLDPKKKVPVDDFLRYWMFENCKAKSMGKDGLSENSRYAHIEVAGGGCIRNLGNNGNMGRKEEPAMSIISGHTYVFTCYIRGQFDGKITVSILDQHGKALCSSEESQNKISPTSSWEQIRLSLKGEETGFGALQIILDGKGRIDLDLVEFYDSDYWNAGDPKYKYGKFRKDLIQKIAALKPAFMRFPGGCIVEGRAPLEEYDWKETIGPLYDRKSKDDLWAEKVPDGGYNQSFQIGFYEYFCLCEDLHMKPMPILPAGIFCQFRSLKSYAIDSKEFQHEVDNYLDLIEFANGDPKDSKWAKIRADMGHPEPFGLSMIGVGNENFGKRYNKRFEIIEKIIHSRYPEIRLIYCSGGLPTKAILAPMWRFAKKHNRTGFLDEHSYNTPSWFINSVHRYDDYERGTTKVYVGEYAANSMLGVVNKGQAVANSSESALAEAAFLTGLERNGDVVAMSSYAPLFNLVSGTNWTHNLIDFSPNAVSETANYHVQRMFGANYGSEYVEPIADLPEGVFASAGRDGNQIYIKLVNVKENDHRIRIATDLSRASVEQLHAPLDARNDLTFFGEREETVRPEVLPAEVRDGFLEMALPAYSVQVITLSQGEAKG